MGYTHGFGPTGNGRPSWGRRLGMGLGTLTLFATGFLVGVVVTALLRDGDLEEVRVSPVTVSLMVLAGCLIAASVTRWRR